MTVEEFIRRAPKAELHLHIEGTLEPELLLELGRRNRVPLRFADIDQVRAAYRFTDLQSFLDIYYEGAKVLIQERDFFDLTWAYLERAAAQNIRHAEIFFDPQTHTARGVPFAAVIQGIQGALEKGAATLGISSRLILCFLRHLSADDARVCLGQALPFKSWIAAVGLDSSERGNPPEKFRDVFALARAEGFLAVAHAGEEGPPEYVRQALDLLKVSRIDHGVRCLEDKDLVARLARERVPLTVCPLSNVKLRVFDTLEGHNIRRLLDAGLCATVNSDDPAYFGGYMLDNLLALRKAVGLTADEAALVLKNGFEASFLPQAEKRRFVAEIEALRAGVGQG